VVVEEFVEAQAIGTRHALRLAAAADLGSGPEIGQQEAELLGWVMGDGSVAYLKSRTYSAELLKRSGYDHKNPVPFVLSLSASQRAAFIRGFFGAEGWLAGGRTLKGRTGYPKTRTYYQNDGASQDAIILAIYLSGMRRSRQVGVRRQADGWY
jgi:hypothetical protein